MKYLVISVLFLLAVGVFADGDADNSSEESEGGSCPEFKCPSHCFCDHVTGFCIGKGKRPRSCNRHCPKYTRCEFSTKHCIFSKECKLKQVCVPSGPPTPVCNLDCIEGTSCHIVDGRALCC